MIIFCITLLPNCITHAIPEEIQTAIKPTQVTDKLTEVAVAPIITTLSTDSNTEVSVLYLFL